ncbi:hypothetical protein K9F62_10425 [Desulfovibrio sp. JY]|nr:hypothetical protein K9F62_10425 [Desulfovibrio sp. JY]
MQAWTPKRAAAKTRRKIKAIREQLEGIANIWGGEDNYIDTLVSEAMEHLDDIQGAVSEHLAGDAE